MRRLVISFGLAIAVSLAATGVALAVLNNGEMNGLDSNINGWIGNDNPDGLTASYSIDNTWQDFYLSEWAEPNHDMLRERFIRWGNAQELKLNTECPDRFITMEMRVHDQYYYNGTGVFASNLPFSSALDWEGPAEELL